MSEDKAFVVDAALIALMTELDGLRALAKEIDGCWLFFEDGIRDVIGHTNYNVIARKLAEALERDQ